MTDDLHDRPPPPESDQRIAVVVGDITTLPVDAIVNAANAQLRPGGGVCGAIHRAAGPALAQACAAIGYCDTGDAVTTPGLNLPARFVIHAVGPVWHGGGQGEALALASCYRSILREADHARARTVAIPAISTGIYGYPLAEASAVAVAALRQSLPASQVERVDLVAFDNTTRDALLTALGRER